MMQVEIKQIGTNRVIFSDDDATDVKEGLCGMMLITTGDCNILYPLSKDEYVVIHKNK